MGRQAKLKKQRKQSQNEPVAPENSKEENNPTGFVERLEKEGYSLKSAQNSPEIPDNSVKPQI